MVSLSDIAQKLRGTGCKRLVKQTANEIAVGGSSFGVGDFKIDIGSFSNKIKEFYKVTQVTVALDNSQYLLCNAISSIKDDQSLKEDCTRIRLQLILAFNQLQAILGSIDVSPIDELNKELAKWVRFMTQLNKRSISLLSPGPRLVSKGVDSELTRITKYQGIDERALQEALSILR